MNNDIKSKIKELKKQKLTLKWLKKWIDDHENFGDINALQLLKAANKKAKT